MKLKSPIILTAIAMVLTGCGNGNVGKNSASDFDLELLPCDYRSGGTLIRAYERDGEQVLHYQGSPKDYGNPIAGMFYDGRAYIMVDGFNGFIDKEGNELFEIEGKANPYITEGIAIVQRGDMIVACDTEGNEMWEIEGRSCTSFRAGYAVLLDKNNNLNIIDSKGEIIFESSSDEYVPWQAMEVPNIASMAHPTYFEIRDKQGFAYVLDVKTGEHFLKGCMPNELSNREGIFIDSNNLVVAQTEDRKYGILDLNGNWAVEPEYSKIRNDGKWYMFLDDDDQWGWMDKDGNVKIEPIAKFPHWWISPGFGYGDIAYIGEGQFINREGNIVLETDFAVDSNFIGDRCLIDKGQEGYTWMNRDGEEICDPFPLDEHAKTTIRRLSNGSSPQYVAY